jgi:hypothetical protein
MHPYSYTDGSDSNVRSVLSSVLSSTNRLLRDGGVRRLRVARMGPEVASGGRDLP